MKRLCSFAAWAAIGLAASATAATISLGGTSTSNTTLQNGDVATGTLQRAQRQITIADGATVTLRDVTIDCATTDTKWAGITCLGDATIVLEGDNTVKGVAANYPGIYVPSGKTLTIRGEGTLNASSGGGYGAGIGSKAEESCGNIVIEGGDISATGGGKGPGIGCGWGGTCGAVTIGEGIVRVVATCATGLLTPIGVTMEGSCGTITVPDGMYDKTIDNGGESGTTRTIYPQPDYKAWVTANGVAGGMGGKDANGLSNLFRYVFGVPEGDFEKPLIDIAIEGDQVVVTTPEVANTKGVEVSIKESGDLAGTEEVVNHTLEEAAAGMTKSDGSRFYRLSVEMAE